MTDVQTSVLPLTPGRWALDPAHSSVGFSIRHLGVSKVRGRFHRFDVDVVVGTDLASSSVTATIDMSSLDTGNADRDAHVLSADIIDVAARPTMTFRSRQIHLTDVGCVIDGDLTIGGVTCAQRLDVEFGGVQDFLPGMPRHAGFEARGELRRRDFGIDVTLPPGIATVALGDVVKLELDVQLLEPTR